MARGSASRQGSGGERQRRGSDVVDPQVVALEGHDQVVPGGGDRHPVDAAAARDTAVGHIQRRADPLSGVGSERRLRVHIHEERPPAVGQGDVAAVERDVALTHPQADDRERQRPAACRGAGNHVEPRQVAVADVDAFVRVGWRRMPAVVAVRVVAASPQSRRVRLPVHEELVRRAAVLEREQATVGAPGLVFRVVVAGVGAPGPPSVGEEERPAGVIRDPGHVQAERPGTDRREIGGFRHVGRGQRRPRVAQQAARGATGDAPLSR